jgi:glutamyl-tRNA synthetase
MTISREGRGRFAPSPTGPLHLGNLRTALLAWLFARQAGGDFIMRIEDVDRQRCRPGITPQMLADLRWLGIDWDEGPDMGGPFSPYSQSRRTPVYRRYLEILIQAGLVYPCYCSRADIADALSAPHAGQANARYPGTCAELDGQERPRLRNPDRPPSYRFRVPNRMVSARDRLHGDIACTLHSPDDDFVVWRADGAPAYHLAVVVDDELMRVGEIVRGEDLMNSVPLQAALIDALGFAMPLYGHVPLWRDSAGNRLSKRDRSTGLDVFREAGMSPPALVGMLAESCGLVPPGTPVSAGELLASFKPSMLVAAHHAR